MKIDRFEDIDAWKKARELVDRRRGGEENDKYQSSNVK